MNSHIEPAGYQDDPYAQAYPETTPFWAAAQRQQLLLKTCNQCKQAHWYPRIVCPLCGSDDTGWQPASGRGSIYAFSIIERADPPYALTYIALDEGPVMLSNLVDCDLRSLRIGQRVSAVFRQTPDGRCAPCFTTIA